MNQIVMGSLYEQCWLATRGQYQVKRLLIFAGSNAMYGMFVTFYYAV